MSKKVPGRVARLDITADPPILVDGKRCDLCGACVAICPANCIKLEERSLAVIGPDCIKCGFCIPACPVEALKWNDPALLYGAIESEGDGNAS